MVFAELTPPVTADEALVEADRCLECGGPYAEAPCTLACPANVDVPGFVAALARGDADAAAETILAENLLGGTCARVCPVQELCEGACVLPSEGRGPISIGRLQRYAMDTAFANGPRLRRRRAPTRRRIAVLGAGPAGLACAGELALRGHDVTVYDTRREIGGLARFAIAPYRLLREPLPQEQALLEQLGVTFDLGRELDSKDALDDLDADAVVLATGLGADVDVRYPGDELPGVWQSLDFIEAIKLRRPPAVGARVVVIGGGNTAIDVAREAKRLGAGEVTVLYRRTEAEMPAYPHEVEEAREEGVEFSWLTVPVRFLGFPRLEWVDCRELRLGRPDASGRPRPEEIPGSGFLIAADTAVRAIGQRPHAELADWIDGLELRNGRVVADPETGQTRNPRYFAAGDAVNGGATVVEAVREAKLAARGVDAWLGGRS
jgi:dihydropyrimidine dehydrogenase (NAD+) subunit PreT